MKPEHYNTGDVDPLDLIASAGYSVLEGFCRGNVIKYVFRYKEKGGISDLQKVTTYTELLFVLEQFRQHTLEKTKQEPIKLPPLKELRTKYGRV